MPSSDSTKKLMAMFTAFTVITGGGLGTFIWTSFEKINQIHSNTTNIEKNRIDLSQRITVNTFKRYTLTNDLENAKAKLSQFERMGDLTLNQQAEVYYLTDALSRWQNKLNELIDE